MPKSKTKKSKTEIIYRDAGEKYYTNVVVKNEDYTVDLNTELRSMTVSKKGRTLVTALRFDSINDFLMVEPKAVSMIRVAMKEHKRLMQEGMYTEHAYNQRTMLRGENIFFSINKKNFLKNIAEAESPLELTRFSSQCEFSHGGYAIIFGTTCGSIGKNTDINTIIPVADWQKIRELAKKAIERKAA